MTNLILINKNKIMNKIILFFKSMNLLYFIQKKFLNYNYTIDLDDAIEKYLYNNT